MRLFYLPQIHITLLLEKGLKHSGQWLSRQLISSNTGVPTPHGVHLQVARWLWNAGLSLPKRWGLIKKGGPTIRNVTTALQKATSGLWYAKYTLCSIEEVIRPQSFHVIKGAAKHHLELAKLSRHLLGEKEEKSISSQWLHPPILKMKRKTPPQRAAVKGNSEESVTLW